MRKWQKIHMKIRIIISCGSIDTLGGTAEKTILDNKAAGF